MKNFKVIFITGPPRSGTTFIARLISHDLRIPLFPETQFLERLFERWSYNDSTNQYIERNWPNISFSDGSDEAPKLLVSALSKKYLELYDYKLNTETNLIFIDHTPQNVLVLRNLVPQFHEPIVIFCLRSPVLSVLSLWEQPWFSGNIFKASFYNLKCLVAGFRALNHVNYFVDIENQMSIDKVLSNVGKLSSETIHIGEFDNLYINSTELADSHKFLFTNKSAERGILYRLLGCVVALPNLCVYSVLKVLALLKAK